MKQLYLLCYHDDNFHRNDFIFSKKDYFKKDGRTVSDQSQKFAKESPISHWLFVDNSELVFN